MEKSLVHNMSLHQKWVDKMKSGEKNVEVRLLDDKRKLIKKGDEIVFNNEVFSTVLFMRYYDSFEDLAKNEDITKVLPGVNSWEEGIEIYKNIYPIQNTKIVAFHLQTFQKVYQGGLRPKD